MGPLTRPSKWCQNSSSDRPLSRQLAMITTHSPAPRETAVRRAASGTTSPHSASEAAAFDATLWQRILQGVRAQHPSLNRTWFDQMSPRQLTNGVIQVTVGTPAQLNFC